MKPTHPADPQLRASGELLHQIKTGGLTPNEAASYARMLHRADSNGILDPDSYSDDNIDKIIKLQFAVMLADNSLMLNPHVAQIGDKTKRGELRKRFKKALASKKGS